MTRMERLTVQNAISLIRKANVQVEALSVKGGIKEIMQKMEIVGNLNTANLILQSLTYNKVQ